MYTKVIVPVAAFSMIVAGVFMTGSYDPYNEFSVFSLDEAGATGITRCEDLGYDHQIAKFEWSGSSYSTEFVKDGHDAKLSGDATSTHWTNSSDVAGVIAKAATVAEEFGGGTSGTINKSDIGTGKHDISHVILCGNEPEPEPTYCKLELTKSVDMTDAKPGDTLTYTIAIKSVGTADCTGGGVKIQDHLDAGLAFVSATQSGNISAGYQSTPVYENGTVTFNGHELTPGEEGEMTITATVKEPAQCGDFEIKNKAKATALELDNFATWIYSNQVQTDVADDCTDIPERPICPFTPKEGRTIVEFTERIRSDKGSNQAITSVVPVNLSAGTYSVEAFSWDGYVGRKDTKAQPLEQWTTVLVDATGHVAESNAVSDIADGVESASVQEIVNNALVVPTDATGVKAMHVYVGTDKTPNSVNPICVALDKEPEETPVPVCNAFSASKSVVAPGETVTLDWNTSYAYRAIINNGVGDVAGDGTVDVTLQDSITYILSVLNDKQEVVDTCEVHIEVETDENTVPKCVSFTGTPVTLPFGGGTTTLAWDTENADTVTLSGVGAVAKDDSLDIFVDTDTTFTLTLEDTDGDTATCEVPVTVEEPEASLSCAADVNFSISDTSVDEGDTVTLDWNASNRIDSVSINQGIGAVATTGSESVTVNSDTTFTLTAVAGNETLSCPVSVDVDNGGGGGGGGSSSPRCDLDISATRIDAGDEVTLTWETSRATEVSLEDDRGEIIFTTDDLLNDDKDDWYDGSITVSPTRDTEYTLTAERGSRDRECVVSVRIDDNDVVVIENRVEPPLVAGIALSEVPYTGFEAGPILTMLFYAILAAWALYVAYYLVIKRDVFAGDMPGVVTIERPVESSVAEKQAENYPHLFVQAVKPPMPNIQPTVATVTETAPSNLPTGTMPAIGYATAEVNPVAATVTDIEDQAHAQGTLLSSDAIKQLMSVTTETNRSQTLDCVIASAKVRFPVEDGWLVLNKERMTELCAECLAPEVPAPAAVRVPTGTGSLAEAVVTGNVAGAYALIGNRPMISVADAVADLDAAYRARKGERVEVSEMLTEETKNLTDEQMKNAISALTSALDGTYSTEEEAVKMAIMKAVKAVA